MTLKDFDLMPSDPKDWPTLPCPDCGERSLLAYGSVLCEVIDCPGPAVRVYGNMNGGITVPAQLRDDPAAMALCNRNGCNWLGTIKEAKDAHSPGWKERYAAEL